MKKKNIGLMVVMVLIMTAAPVLLGQPETPASMAPTHISQPEEPQDVEIPIDFGAAEYILVTGIGGVSVTALVEIIKRLLKAQGIAVIILSVFVSAGATALYIFSPIGGGGFDILKFVVLTTLVAAAANGYKLVPKTRTPA